jgi:dethiobiotin synthetase
MILNLDLMATSSASRPRGYFITGTDTGVGKTLVATGIVRMLTGRGCRVVGLKPVATGAAQTPEGLINDDAIALARESSIRLPYALTNPYCFEPAIAPHLAAEAAGAAIAVDQLVDWYARATPDAEIVIVEGAGGWRVPLHPTGFLSDLPERLGLGVILVVGLRLGCLNHARLTYEAITRTARCPLVGWIGNRIDPGFESADANVQTLERLLGGPALALLPALAAPSATAAAPHLAGPRLRVALGLGD